MTPVYAVIKPEWKINDEWKFFNKYKAGWSFNSKKGNENFKLKSAPYIGIGAGTEWKNFSVEVSYEINYISNKSPAIHQLGVTVGYTFNKRKPYKLTSEAVHDSNKKNKDIQYSKPASLEIKQVNTSDKNNGEEKKPKEDKKKEYWKWFSFDEEINK